jgi:hypothetical protein
MPMRCHGSYNYWLVAHINIIHKSSYVLRIKCDSEVLVFVSEVYPRCAGASPPSVAPALSAWTCPRRALTRLGSKKKEANEKITPAFGGGCNNACYSLHAGLQGKYVL